MIFFFATIYFSFLRQQLSLFHRHQLFIDSRHWHTHRAIPPPYHYHGRHSFHSFLYILHILPHFRQYRHSRVRCFSILISRVFSIFPFCLHTFPNAFIKLYYLSPTSRFTFHEYILHSRVTHYHEIHTNAKSSYYTSRSLVTCRSTGRCGLAASP